MCSPCFGSKPRPPLETRGSEITVKNPVAKPIPKPQGIEASPAGTWQDKGFVPGPGTAKVNEAFIKEFGGK